MKKYSEFICKNKIAIIVISLLLLIPSIIGYVNTKINYDILVYLPKDIETVKGQNILKDDFDTGAFAIVVADNKRPKQLLDYETKIKKVESVNMVLSMDDVLGTSIPFEVIPDEMLSNVKKGDKTLLFITFEGTTSDSKTLNAISSIREIMDGKNKVGGLSGIVLDTMNLSNSEILIYVVIAVILCIIVLSISLDSFIVPILLLFNIGIAIIYNMGSNFIFGDISYITKAINAVLQLGVTTDFSIFLYHKYQSFKNNSKNNDEAMSKAICETITSVFGSALTTIAGFIALCAMNLTLGKDIGLVMAKGVLFGLITVVTLFPALLLVFDKLIIKTKHKPFLPKFELIKKLSIKNYKVNFVLFLILLIPAVIGNHRVNVYYNLDRSLPNKLDSIVANEQLKNEFNIVSPQIVILDKKIKSNKVSNLIESLKNIEGINMVLGTNEFNKYGVPIDMISKDLGKITNNNKYQLIIINSIYSVASPELTNQINEIIPLIKEYDSNAILAGEGPLTNDLIKTSDKDFKNVNFLSIGVIFILMLIVLKSISLPVLLIFTIEFAIFVNIAISYYRGITIPFISSIVIGTIQLGATIDYAILMTTKYIELRKQNIEKMKAIKETLDSSVSSIIVSALCFFAATIGVGIYTDLELIGSICSLLSRGSLISMAVVILVLPSLLIIFDKVIIKTTKGFKKGNLNMKKKVLNTIILTIMLILPFSVNATSKEETVYTNLNTDGSVNKIVVSNHLSGLKEGEYIDKTILSDIENTNGDETFKIDRNKLTWKSNGTDIFYKGVANKQLPISINVKYYLDDKEYSEKDLEGKSGHVKIVINYNNNLKNNVKVNGKKQVLYTPFLVAGVSIIDTNNNSNVKINNGKIIDNGVNFIVVGIASPGLYDSVKIDDVKDFDKLVIEYDTKSYKFSNIYNVVTSNLDLDIDFDNFEKIYKNINTLTSSYKKIVNGTKELNNGIDSLNKNYKEFNNGISKLNDGVKSLKEGYNTLNSGIQKYNDSVNELGKYLDYVHEADKTINNLSTYSNDIAKTSNSINDAVNDNIYVIKDHIESLKKISDKIEDKELKELINSEIDNLKSKLDMEELQKIKNTINTINDKVNYFNDNVEQIVKTADKIDNGATTLVTSMNKIASSSDLVNDKIGELSSSLNTIKNYSNKIYSGTKKLASGSNELYDGVSKFQKQGINKIASLVNNEIKPLTRKVEKLIDLGNDYNSYSLKSDGTKGTTKFIMIISK